MTHPKAKILARLPHVKTVCKGGWRGGHLLCVIIARTLIIITVKVSITITTMATSVS